MLQQRRLVEFHAHFTTPRVTLKSESAISQLDSAANYERDVSADESSPRHRVTMHGAVRSSPSMSRVFRLDESSRGSENEDGDGVERVRESNKRRINDDSYTLFRV